MFNTIVSVFNGDLIYNTIVSGVNGGLIYKCFKDFYDESRKKSNVYILQSNSIFNYGMIIGCLFGFVYKNLNCPESLKKMLKFEN